MDNVLLVCSDLHRPHNRGYVMVAPDCIFRIRDRLRDEFQNARRYRGLDGARIAVPERELCWPKTELL